MPDGQNLFGLSPEQIGQISGRRIQRETQAAQTTRDLANIQAQREAMKPVELRFGEDSFTVPKGQVTEGMKAYNTYLNDMATRAKTAQETEQLRLNNQPIEMQSGDRTFNLPVGMVKAISEATETFQQVGARERIADVTPETLTQAPYLGAAAVGAPGVAVAGLQQAAAKPGGLSPTEQRQAVETQRQLLRDMEYETKNINPGNLDLLNQMSSVLNQPVMYYPVPAGRFQPGDFRAQIVQLPVLQGQQITPAWVEEKARKDKKTVFETLEALDRKFGGR